jgi:hypothetical protein
MFKFKHKYFQKFVVGTKLDIYEIPLLVDV